MEDDAAWAEPWFEDDEGDDRPDEIEEEEWTDFPDLWVAHDRPERPLASGAWLCDCPACALALHVAALHQPRLAIVLKTGSDRVVVTAEYADQVWSTMGSLEPLCYVRRDYIREVFVASAEWMWWMRSDRWWSLTRSERVASRRTGLRCATRSPSLHGFSDVDHARVPRHLVPGWTPCHSEPGPV